MDMKGLKYISWSDNSRYVRWNRRIAQAFPHRTATDTPLKAPA